MKIKNTTNYPDHFLRRLVSWCCQQLDLPVRRLHLCTFGNSRSVWGGLCYGRRRIGVKVGSEAACNRELKHWKFNDGFQIVTHSRLEVLVATTAHELAHVEQAWRRALGGKRLERRTEARAAQLLNLFRATKESLLVEWNQPPAPRATKPKKSVTELRADKVQRDLDRWQRKLKLAQTKVRKLKQKAGYYERQAAKRGAQ